MLLAQNIKLAQPPVNLTQKLGNVFLQIEEN
jgi:hypothetical protein